MRSPLSPLQKVSQQAPRWTSPLLLAVVAVASYGLLIPWLGFYWDDWPALWFRHSYGPGSFVDVWAQDRPVLGYLFMLTTSILGNKAWQWQLFALVTRLLSALTFMGFLRALWPDRQREAVIGSLLLLVYPGFRQHPISLIYGHYHLILALQLVSLILTVKALREPSRAGLLLLGSWITGAIGLFSMEFFLGLELIRPFVMILVVQQERRGKGWIRRVLARWWPFALLLIGYLLWRVLVVQFQAYQPELLSDLSRDLLTGSLSLLPTIALDVYQSTFLAWWDTLQPPAISSFGRFSTAVYWGLVSVTFLAVMGALWVQPREPRELGGKGHRWQLQVVVVGLLGMLLGGWPFWIPKLSLSLSFPWDRFTLSMMFGATLVILGLTNLIRLSWARALVLGVLIALAVGFQFRIANEYRRSWDMQGRFFWQLIWRVPDLEEGTLILTHEVPLDFVTDNSFTAPINWLYAPEFNSHQMPFLLLNVEKRLGGSLPSLEVGTRVYKDYRAAEFRGTTSQALVIDYQPPGCLRVADQVLDDSSTVLSGAVKQSIHLSRLDLIRTDSAARVGLPDHLIGAEPAGTWCYYFERADLARQRKDWQEIVSLGEEAFNQPDQPNQAEERIPFVEGYAHVGDYNRAADLIRISYQQSPAAFRILCHAWERVWVQTDPPESELVMLRQVWNELGCREPYGPLP